jgi:CelD/BcsL family acetyltransferase involved in cellulose biosynthesis
MHIDRWAKKGGSIYLDPRNAHQMMEIGKLAVGKEMGAIHELLIDGEVAAQVICIYDGEVVRGMRQGISEKFLEYSPGKLAIMMCMETLRAEGFKRMDLGHGDEPYKSHMKTSECSLPSFQVERGGLRAMRKVRSFPPIRQMDQRFQLSDRMLGRNRSHLSCTTDASRSPKVVQVNEST